MSATVFSKTAGTRLATGGIVGVDELVQRPASGDVPARLAGVVVGIKDGLAYVLPLSLPGRVRPKDIPLIVGGLAEFEYATEEQAANAGRYLARLVSIDRRMERGEWWA